jgi:oligopeptide transport system permease protein
MSKFLIRRLLYMIPVLLLISLVTFTLMKMTPGGPWDKGEGQRQVSQTQREILNRKFNLDKPEWQQYLLYMWGAIRGDLGPSFQYKDRNVSDILFEPPEGKGFWESKFGRSATLGLIAAAIGLALGLPIGILAAVKQNSWIDYLSLFIATLGTSVPSFVMAIFMILLFSYSLHWLPVIGDFSADWKPWVMPTIVLSFGLVAFLARLTRATMLEQLRQDYVRTARAKGLVERVVIFKHTLKNSLIPVATVMGPAVAGLITGTFFIEYMFSFPGMGRYFVQAISQRDYSMIMGTTLFYALVISLANLTVDVVYGWLDPRIKVS